MLQAGKALNLITIANIIFSIHLYSKVQVCRLGNPIQSPAWKRESNNLRASNMCLRLKESLDPKLLPSKMKYIRKFDH